MAVVIALSAASLTATAADAAKRTKIVSVSQSGDYGNDDSRHPSSNGNGRLVAFDSLATNLFLGPDFTPGESDIFVRNNLTGLVERVSINTDGAQANDASSHPSISADGRFVAFDSDADNLVDFDLNDSTDVFVHDRKKDKTKRISISSKGVEGDFNSLRPSVSGDGRFVAFFSGAANLVGKDVGGHDDVFVRDRRTNKTRRVSKRSNGKQGNGNSGAPAISANGRFVAFDSVATNLVKNDKNGHRDVFVHDRATGKTRRVSVRSDGKEAKSGHSSNPAISANGRFVAFHSDAINLVKNDTNGDTDVVLHDRKTGKTTLISKRSDGKRGDDDSVFPTISGDGRLVAFSSYATTLIKSDTNALQDVFLRDRKKGKTKRLSIRTTGKQVTGESFRPSISKNGKWVAFSSDAADLVIADANGSDDIFRRGPLR